MNSFLLQIQQGNKFQFYLVVIKRFKLQYFIIKIYKIK